MALAFDDDERELIDETGRQLRGLFPASRLTASPDDGDQRPGWRRLAQTGVLHALDGIDSSVPLPLPVRAAIAREAGRVLLVDSFVNNSLLIPRLIAAIDAPAERAAHLDRHTGTAGFLIADARVPGIVAPDEAVEWVPGVVAGFDAYVVTDTDGVLSLSRLPADRIRCQAEAELAHEVARVEFERESLRPVPLALSRERLDEILAEAALIHAAGLIGTGEAAVQASVDYARMRQQFGRPVGQFQAVKHLLAEAWTGLCAAWAACLMATVTRDPADEHAGRVLAMDAAAHAARVMLQVHGGIGFTWEHGCHRYLKTAFLGTRRFGGRDRLVRALARMEHPLGAHEGVLP